MVREEEEDINKRYNKKSLVEKDYNNRTESGSRYRWCHKLRGKESQDFREACHWILR